MTAISVVFALLLWRPWHTPTPDELLGPPPRQAAVSPEPRTLVTCIIEDLPVPQAVAEVARSAGIDVQVAWGETYLPWDGGGGERRVTMYLRGVPVRAALELALQQSAANWLDVAFADGQWRIDDDSHAIRQELLWAYDVRELLTPHILMHTELPPMSIERLLPSFARDQGGYQALFFGGEDERVEHAGSALMQVLYRSIDPENWRDQGGVLYSGEVMQGILHLAASPEVHARAHHLLYQLWLGLEDRLPSEGPSAALLAALAALDEPLAPPPPEMTVKQLPRHLHEVAGLNIAADWRALGITSDRPITIPHGPLTARSLLNANFPAIDAPPDRPEWYVIDEGVIVITPRPAHQHVRPIVYALGDAFDPPPVDAPGAPGAQSEETPIDEVVRRLTNIQMSPFVFPFGRALVVNTTADGHVIVAREIKRLRAEAER